MKSKKLLITLLSFAAVVTASSVPTQNSMSRFFSKADLSAYANDSEHEHNYTAKVTEAPTCTKDGVRTYTCDCGDTYTEPIFAIGHKYVKIVIKPTYLNKGYTLYKCSICTESYEDSYTSVKTVPLISGAKISGTSYNSLKLSWAKNSNVEGYVIYRFDDVKNRWIRLSQIKDPNITSYTVTGLQSAKQHQIAVKGYVTENGKEVGSPKLSIVKATTNPGVVSNFKTSANTSNSVKLTWSKVNGAEGYVVYRYNPSTKGWIRLAKIKGTSYTATGLASGTSYKFAVKSYITLNGREFGGSKLTQVFTSTNPDKVNFTVTSPSAGRSDFKWSKVRGATGYIVYYKANAKDVWHRMTVTNGTSYTKTGLQKGNTYSFTVKAYRTTGGVTYNGTFTAKTLKISNKYKIEKKNGITYIDGVLIANKSYRLPSNYNPGLTAETKNAFAKMQQDAKNDGIYIWITSGFRSYSYQAQLYQSYVYRDGQAAADRYAARAGYSEHQTGLALDVNNASYYFDNSKEAKWVAANCWKYGFILRYPQGKEHITGYQYESWHIRYVGNPLAKELTKNNLTLEEYFGITSRY